MYGQTSKRDATRVKDLYYNQMMLHIDIEADCNVARFFKEMCSYDIDRYLRVYYEGANAFRDEEIRPLKFERFVGSMMSLCHFFEYHKMAIYRLSSEAVRLYLNNLKAIIHKGSHSESKTLDLGIEELYILQDLYHEPHNFIPDEYISKLKNILVKAIKVDPSITPDVIFT